MPLDGLEWLDPIYVFGMLLCLLIAYLGYKQKSPAIMLVSCFGWIIIGFRIFEAAQDYLVLGLMVMVAFSQFFLAWRK